MSTVEYALKTEHDAELFYLKQAEETAGLKVEAMFRQLAKAKQKHQQHIRDTVEGARDIVLSDRADESTIYSERAPFVSEVRDRVSAIEACEFAMQIEQESIDIYQRVLTALDGKTTLQAARERRLLNWLIAEEEANYNLFYELSEMIRIGEEHVEAAEFANPQEY